MQIMVVGDTVLINSILGKLCKWTDPCRACWVTDSRQSLVHSNNQGVAHQELPREPGWCHLVCSAPLLDLNLCTSLAPTYLDTLHHYWGGVATNQLWLASATTI